MVREREQSSLGETLLSRPFQTVYFGLALTLVAIIGLKAKIFSDEARLILVAAGVVLATTGVLWRLAVAENQLEENQLSAALVALGGLSVLGGYVALGRAWPELKVPLIALWGLSLLGTLLVQARAILWESLLSGPFRLVYAGIGMTLVAMLLTLVATAGEPPVTPVAQVKKVPPVLVYLTVVLLVSGLIAAGCAVRWRLRLKDEGVEHRQMSAALIAFAGLAVLATYFAMHKDWDSMRLAMVGLGGVCAAGALIVALPAVGRKIVISLLLIYHFGGILTATTAVQPHNNASIPWVPSWMWTNVYRHYLSFSYLNNAYHFYSPEPGPPNLLWFRVEFEPEKPGGETYVYWKRLVNRSEYPTRLQYQRLLALTESTNHPQAASWPRMNELNRARFVAAGLAQIKIRSNGQLDREYQEPSEQAKKYIRSYVRHVARTTKHPDDPDRKIQSIKLYRLTHTLINAYQIGGGMSPLDPTLYWPYFLGEFNAAGELNAPKDNLGRPMMMQYVDLDANGAQIPVVREAQDPFLYWLLPVYRDADPNWPDQEWWEMRVINCFEKHAEGEDRGKFFKVKYFKDSEGRVRSIP